MPGPRSEPKPHPLGPHPDRGFRDHEASHDSTHSRQDPSTDRQEVGTVALTWTPYAIPGLAAGLLGPVLGWIVYQVSPERDQNRLLALLLVLAGLEVATSFGLVFMATTDPLRETIDAFSTFAVLASPWVYLAFLGTIPTPLTRPLRSRRLQWGLVVLAGALIPLWPLIHGDIASSYEDGSRIVTPAFRWALSWHGFVLFYGLLVAVSALLFGPEQELTRGKRRAYALAFGTRDAGLAFAIFGAQFFAIFGIDLSALVSSLGSGPIEQVLFVSAPTLVFILLLAYGVLSAQLFVVDLKIKEGLKRAGIVGGFVFVFFLVSEGLETLLAGTVGDWAGLAAAGLLAFMFRPLERAADRAADQVMPDVEDTAAYRQKRKREIYGATVEDLLADRELSERDRRILTNLRDQLGLEASSAEEIEDRVREQLDAEE